MRCQQTEMSRKYARLGATFESHVWDHFNFFHIFLITTATVARQMSLKDIITK
jgi:hypothetical protein